MCPSLALTRKRKALHRGEDQATEDAPLFPKMTFQFGDHSKHREGITGLSFKGQKRMDTPHFSQMSGKT